jgi:hypothetical protein
LKNKIREIFRDETAKLAEGMKALEEEQALRMSMREEEEFVRLAPKGVYF